MLHIITSIFCFLISPFRALHNCLFKKRLRKHVLPKYVNEDDSINALLPTKVSKDNLMNYYDKICGKKTDTKLSAMLDVLSPDLSDEVQNLLSGK